MNEEGRLHGRQGGQLLARQGGLLGGEVELPQHPEVHRAGGPQLHGAQALHHGSQDGVQAEVCQAQRRQALEDGAEGHVDNVKTHYTYNYTYTYR